MDDEHLKESWFASVRGFLFGKRMLIITLPILAGIVIVLLEIPAIVRNARDAALQRRFEPIQHLWIDQRILYPEMAAASIHLDRNAPCIRIEIDGDDPETRRRVREFIERNPAPEGLPYRIGD